MKTNAFLQATLIAVTALLASVPLQAQQPRIVEDPNDVMNGAKPKLPTFPKLAKKPGHIRGWVKVAQGKPLKNARISLSSTTIGGAKTYVTDSSDEKDLYELLLPRGACAVDGAGYVLTLGGMRANLPLHPVDGEINTFSSQKGDIENFVLLPFGVANPGGASEHPDYEFYYGGSLRVVYWIRSGDNLVPVGSTIEILLQPRGPLIDGTQTQPLVIRQPVDDSAPGVIHINNIPATTYNITARLIRGNCDATTNAR